MPFSIERNDLARMHVDAVVVAANENLQVTGGVGAVVAQAAGLDRVQAACDEIGFCPTGSAVSTPGFDLPAHTIIHAVGPVWRTGGRQEMRLLASAYAQALQRAVDADARSVALPLLSAGTYGCPAEVSFSLAMDAVRAFLDQYDIDVRVVLYSRDAVTAGLAAYGDIASYIDDHYVDEHTLYAREADDLVRRDVQRHFEEAPQRLSAPAQPEGSSYRAAPAQPKGSSYQAALPQSEEKKRRGFLSRLRERHQAERRSAAMPEPQADMLAPVDEREAYKECAPVYGSASMPDASAPVGEREAYEECTSAFAPESMASPSFAGIPAAAPCSGGSLAAPSLDVGPDVSLDELLNAMDAPFSTTLLALIDARGLTDAQVYKRANLSRQHFSRIRSDASYRPTKKTVLALAVALELDLDETGDLLRRAGFALSKSSKADIIVQYFIVRRIYDVFAINEALYSFDQPLL